MVLFAAHNIQPTTLFFNLDQMNSKECLHFLPSNFNRCLFFCFLLFLVFLPHRCFRLFNG